MQTKLRWDAKVLEPIFRELVRIEMTKRPDFIEKLYGVENSTKDTESLESIGGEGLMEEWGQSNNQVYYADVDELWQKYIKNKKFSLGRQIDRDLLDDLKLTAIKDRLRSLGTAVYMTQQYQAVETYNNAFATTTGVDFRGRTYNAAGPDGKALCATDHPYSPTNTTDTQSNKGTKPLSIDAWDETAVEMQGWVDDTGNIMGVFPDTLLVHPYNARKAFQIAGLPGKEAPKYEPGSADFNTNVYAVYNGGITVIVNPFLKNKFYWFAIDSSRMTRMNKWFWRRKPEYGSITDFDTEVAKYKVIGRWSHGFIHYSWIYGHQATE
jgi:hypothetical protein